MNEIITLQAIFNKATTTVDGGWNITFSVDQSQAQKITELSSLRDMVLNVAITPQ
jgi:hypothetical protein